MPPATEEGAPRPPQTLERCTAPVDAAVARLAGSQRGLVTTSQLHRLGLTRHMIDSRVRRGWLHRVHRTVYVVGHATLAPFGREAAALLACGPLTGLSHRSAAGVWALAALPADAVEVTVPTRHRPRHRGVVVHRTTSLEPADLRTREGLRVTSVRRTILDLAAVLGPDDLAAVVNEALVRRLVRREQLELPRGARGAAKLRHVLDGASATRSEAERALLRLIRRARLPLPETNARVAGFEVDLLWRAERVVVEVDGWAFHGDRAAFERDRRRDRALRAAGFTPVRVTPRQVTDEPEAVLVDLAGLVVRRAPWPDRLTA